MKNSIALVSIYLLAFQFVLGNEKFTVFGPDKHIRVNVEINEIGQPYYLVAYDDSLVLKNSKLGIVMTDNDFSKDLKILKVGEVSNVSDSYSLFSEKRSHCVYHANKRKITFSNSKGKMVAITFQVSNDGVAFRYEFEEKSTELKKIISEQTSFHFPLHTKAWLHPHTDVRTGWHGDQPSYEENYKQEINVGTEAPYKAGWSFPGLFKSAGCWVLITETDVDRNYCGSRLSAQSPDGEYALTFPQLLERTDSTAPTFPQSTLPWISPWRIIIVGKTLAPIIESSLVTDVSSPCRLADTSFIQPGKASWSWVLDKDDSTIFPTQKRFIDYASTMHWKYCLVDGYWDTKIGYDKLKELADYAKTKNVGLLLWYNSAGNWNTTPITPRDLMVNPDVRKKEFEKIHNMGFKGIKVDFFGGDGQSFMAYYHDLFEDAAKYKLLINCHGATIPRGWTRTYPNLISMEAVKGFEFVTFEQANTDLEPNHCAMLPFTRNAIGPMDFTPVCFSEVPNLKRLTSNGFEIALSVLFQSGVQHYAEIPEGMIRQPMFVVDFMKQVPNRWDEIKFIDGYPGKYDIIARKGDGKWYIAGINGENKPLDVNIDLSVFGKTKGGILITDGKTNRDWTRTEIEGNQVKLTLKPYGGFVFTLNE